MCVAISYIDPKYALHYGYASAGADTGTDTGTDTDTDTDTG